MSKSGPTAKEWMLAEWTAHKADETKGWAGNKLE